MRRAWAVVVVVGLAFVAAGPAGAQGTGSGFLTLFGGSPGQFVSATNVPAAIHGELVVSFHGDAASGCATYGVCAYSGTVVVRPGSGSLAIVTYRRRGRIAHQATLALGGLGNGLTTVARVGRSAPGAAVGTCADGASSGSTAEANAATHGRSITIRLLAPGGSLLQTRCAGPSDGDLAGAVHAVTLPAAQALHGRRQLDFSGTRTFAAHGFAGTVTSTVVMRLGRPQPQSTSSSPSFPPGIKVARVRTVTQRLNLVRMRGRLGAAVRGTDDPIVCRLLDSCGLTGTLQLTPRSGAVFAYVTATGPARRPYRDFLTALGVTHAGRSRGISVVVFVAVSGGAQASTSQDGAVCTDTGPSAGANANIAVAPGSSLFGLSVTFGTLFGPWRTRCPGPDLENAPGGLKAGLGRGVLRGRDVAVELRAAGSFTDDGYVVTPQGSLSMVLRRGHIHQQVIVQPVS